MPRHGVRSAAPRGKFAKGTVLAYYHLEFECQLLAVIYTFIVAFQLPTYQQLLYRIYHFIWLLGCTWHTGHFSRCISVWYGQHRTVDTGKSVVLAQFYETGLRQTLHVVIQSLDRELINLSTGTCTSQETGTVYPWNEAT